METLKTDILIVGGGSGGFGAALQAARRNPEASVMLIEALDSLGGTSTNAGVNCWEPGVGGMGVHYELYARLSRQPNVCGVGRTIHFYKREEPYGMSEIDPDADYESSLRRAGVPREEWRRFHFEPEAMAQAMADMLENLGVDVRTRTRFIDVEVKERRIQAVIAEPDGGDPYRIEARYFVDCTGGVHLARAAGCAVAFGEDARSAYDEPMAPEKPERVVNGATQVYRVTPVPAPTIDPLPGFAQSPEVAEWRDNNFPGTAINKYPNGDLNMNSLPTMQGAEYIDTPSTFAKRVCEARMYAQWHRLQEGYGFDAYAFLMMFPMIGIRESWRLVGRYVLREQDVCGGIANQARPDEVIAFGDHALDTHGVKGHLGEVNVPYGVPYDCLLPVELDNLIAATRGASFSHIAASSCRLSRTIIALGEAAGCASAIAAAEDLDYGDVPVARVRELMRIPQFTEKVYKEWNL